MILSDSLIEEICQTLITLPYASVAPLINKIQIEIAQQQQRHQEATSATQLDADMFRHRAKNNSHVDE